MKNFLWLAVGTLGMFLFAGLSAIVGYHMGKEAKVSPAPEAVQQDEGKPITGTVWYSELDKAWKIQNFEDFSGNPIRLSKTESLERLVESRKRWEARHDPCCTFVAGLYVRYLKSNEEPKPGSRQNCEIIRVDFVKTDFCFHCEHTDKARRE